MQFAKNSFTDLSGLSCPSFFSQIAAAILFKKKNRTYSEIAQIYADKLVVHRQPQSAGSKGLAQTVGHSGGQQKPGSDMFCEIGPAVACMADYPEYIAPKSPHKYRLKSAIFSERIGNQPFKLAQCSQIVFSGPTWEHQVSEKRLPVGLQRCFFKTYCSQVISSAMAWRLHAPADLDFTTQNVRPAKNSFMALSGLVSDVRADAKNCA